MNVNGKEIMYKYFNEYCYLWDWLQEHREYKMVKYSFTFAYGYKLEYVKR